MTDSLKDQLMQLGFKPKPEPRREERSRGQAAAGHAARARGDKSAGGKPGGEGGKQRSGQRTGSGKRLHNAQRPPQSAEEIDLAKAYALRQRQEQAERAREERARQEEARLRKEARQKLARLLEGKAQNQAEADLARHFEYGGKIRRVHVTEAQFRAINAGELAVVQQAGRYLLVDAAIGREAAALLPSALVLLVDPDAPAGSDEYADPRYQVPDDLVW